MVNRIFTTCFFVLSVSVLRIPALRAQTKPPLTKNTSPVNAVRDDLNHGYFSSAMSTLEKVPQAQFSKNSELLTLRGIAEWGEALRKCEKLSSIATEFGMVRQVSRYLL